MTAIARWWQESYYGYAVVLFSILLQACAKQGESDIPLNLKPKMWSCQYDSLACTDGNWLKSDSVFILAGDNLPFEIWFELRKDMNIDLVPWPDSTSELPNNMGNLYRFEFSLRPKVVDETNNEKDNQETEVAYPCLFKASRWSGGWVLIDSAMVGSLLEERCFKRRIMSRSLRILAGECE